MKTLGQRLETLRISNNETKKFVGQIAQVNGVTVGKWEKDQVVPRDDKLQRLAKHYNVSFEWLRVGVERAQVSPLTEEFSVSINAYDKGAPLLFDSRQLPEGHSERLMYIQISGHSMAEQLPDGSILIIDLDDRHLQDEKLYVLKTHNFISVRKVSFTSSGIRLQSFSHQKDELLTFQQVSNIDVLGRVISSIVPR